jgi:uncharacterized RDD family membrane protein YckC
MPQDLVVLTPEKTVITFRLASLSSRIGAQIIDLMFIFCVLAAGSAVIAFTFGNSSLAPLFIFYVLFPYLYYVLLEGYWNGQTLGKKVAGIRVRMSDGGAITIKAAFLRNLLRVADFFPMFYLAGLLSIFTTPRGQRLGDIAANTVVIADTVQLPIFTPTPYALGVHAQESLLPDLRNMTVEDYIALKKMCDRFPEFPTNVQDRMIRDIWTPIATRLHVPEVPNLHPILLAEATVMKYGRMHGLM